MGMISYDSYLKQIFLGNILLIVCCAFYLAWWMLAFRPENAVKGMRSGWLLIPAAVSGILSVVVILRGMGVETAAGNCSQTVLCCGAESRFISC